MLELFRAAPEPHLMISLSNVSLPLEFSLIYMGFPCGSAGKESSCNAGDLGSIPGLGRSPGEGNGYPLQYSGLENSIVHGVTKSRRGLSKFHIPTISHNAFSVFLP